MSTNHNRQTGHAERRCLIVSASANLVVGCVGLAFAVISSSQAILLDGLFNLTYFATGLFTLKVARLVPRGDDERFPMGYAFFEPLVNGLKGVLVLGVSIMALIGAVQSLFSGGREIAMGAAVGYGVFATAAGWGMAVLTHRGARRSGSPLVTADAENWLVNGAVSSCVLVAFAAMYLLKAAQLDRYVPYVDPIVVLSVVLISIGVPVRMAWRALMELLNRTPSAEIVQQVRSIIEQRTADLPVQEFFVRVIQPGRSRMVLAHVILPADYSGEALRSFDLIRAETTESLQREHLATVLDMVFTTERKWGALSGLPPTT